MIQSSAKTSWFHIALLVVLTIISIYVIKQAFAEPLFEWQRLNEVHAAQIKELTR